MFIKLAKHRKYQYTPRYYDPDKERKEQGKPHSRLHIPRRRNRMKTKSMIWMVAVFAFLVYLLYLLTQLQK